jgi:hypothetical protein
MSSDAICFRCVGQRPCSLPPGWKHNGITSCVHDNGGLVWFDNAQRRWCFQRYYLGILKADGVAETRDMAMSAIAPKGAA